MVVYDIKKKFFPYGSLCNKLCVCENYHIADKTYNYLLNIQMLYYETKKDKSNCKKIVGLKTIVMLLSEIRCKQHYELISLYC